MAALTDPDRLAAYLDALGNWQNETYVSFTLREDCYRWIRHALGDTTTREIARLMHEHVANGGVIDEVIERRAEWSGRYRYHYDLRLVVDDQSVYIETRLHYRLPVVPNDSWICVVNIHAP